MKNMANNLIGLSGKIKNGKDLVGNIINYLTHSNYEMLELERIENGKTLIEIIEFVNKEKYTNYTVKKYADKLKDICCIILGCTRAQLEDREFKETPIPHLTKYYLNFYYEIRGGTREPSNHSITFPNSILAEKFIEEGLYNDCDILDYTLKPIYTTPRDIQNMFGTNCGRNMVHQNIWCEALFADYKGHILTKLPENANILEAYRHNSCRECERSYMGYKRQHYCSDCVDKLCIIYPNWLISDVRFPDNEGKYIKDRGGIVIGVIRKFSLRFPEYAHLEEVDRPYDIPKKLWDIDNQLYKTLTVESEISMGDYQWCDFIIENNGSIEELVEKVKKILWK